MKEDLNCLRAILLSSNIKLYEYIFFKWIHEA